MRFTDVRLVPAATGEVWTALHDSPRGQAGDSYRGTFAIDDTDPGRPPSPQCWPTTRGPGSAVSPPVSGEPR